MATPRSVAAGPETVRRGRTKGAASAADSTAGRPPVAPGLLAREPSAPWVRSPRPGAAVLVDSGPLVALFNRADHWHEPVLHWLKAHPGLALVSTWCVATEVCALLARRIRNEAALDFLRWAERGGVELDGAQPGSVTEILRISERFASLPFDLADASIAEAATRRRIRQVLSIDADFDVYRDRNGRALVNLLK